MHHVAHMSTSTGWPDACAEYLTARHPDQLAALPVVQGEAPARFTLAPLSVAALGFAAPASAAPDQNTVYLDTKDGRITIQLRPDLAPKHVQQLKTLTKRGFYNGVIFNRLVPGFVIQGGDRTGTGTGDPGYKIQDEPVTTPYKRGTVAMARTSAPNSQGSQFFIVLDDAAGPVLEQARTYAILGEVVEGMDVVDAIAKVKTARKGFHDDVPKESVVIEKIIRI